MNVQPQSLSLAEWARSSRPLIIFGASVAGEALLHACRHRGLQVVAFCDNNKAKTDQPWMDTEVIHSSQIRQRYPDAVFIIGVIDIADIVRQLAELGFHDWLPASELLDGFELGPYTFSRSPDFVRHVVATCIVSHNSFAYPDRLYLHSVDVVITERCSLRCQKCSNLMQYYSRPEDAGVDSLQQAIGALCGAVDRISEARVIGGEPLMHKQWIEVTRILLDKPNIDKVVIFTNGTLLPAAPKLEAIASPKLLFIITDYGSLSRNIAPLCHLLDEHHILYVRSPAAGWTDCASLDRHQRSAEKNQDVFKNCCAKNLFTLKDGRLYRCPFAANAASLGAVPAAEGDSVALTEMPRADLRHRLQHFIQETTVISSCDFCNGRRLDDPCIEPARQASAPLPYLRMN